MLNQHTSYDFRAFPTPALAAKREYRALLSSRIAARRTLLRFAYAAACGITLLAGSVTLLAILTPPAIVGAVTLIAGN